MKLEEGVCRFCGQVKMLKVTDKTTQEQLDERVTAECDCQGAKAYKEKKKAEERLEEQKTAAINTTIELFHEDLPEIEKMLNSSIQLLVDGEVEKVTVKTGEKVTGQIGIKGDKIKVERIEKSVYTRETTLG